MLKARKISKKEFAQLGRPSEVTDTMVRFWDGLEVLDAKFNLLVNLNVVDFEHAKARDMFNCAFVESLRRTHNAQYAYFTRTLAYVDLVRPNMPRKVYRFVLSTPARRVIARFDTSLNEEERKKLGQELGKEGFEFELKAPPKKQTLESQRKQSIERRRKRRVRTIMVRGEAGCAPKKNKVAAKKSAEKRTAEAIVNNRRKYGSSVLELNEIRNATGLVQFVKVGRVRESSMSDAAEPVSIFKE